MPSCYFHLIQRTLCCGKEPKVGRIFWSMLYYIVRQILVNFFPLQLTHVKETNNDVVYIIMGKTYAKSLSLPRTLTWLGQKFAINIHNKLVVYLYFDYRQLSNIKNNTACKID
jgi:hypothetical protein